MGFDRSASPAAKKQAVHRHEQAQDRLRQMPQVHGEGYSLYQGDALAIVPLLGSVDHCITDPPYEAEAHTRTRRARAKIEGRAPYQPIDFAPITEIQRRFLTRLHCQWVLIFCQIEASGAYKILFGEPKYKRTCTWVKTDSAPQFTGDRPAQGTEHIVCAWMAPGSSSWNAGGKRGVYIYPIRDGEERVHSTQKPLSLMKALVEDFTQRGDLVLDPFMGSGTTGVACLELGRRFVGIECDPATFAQACTRLAAAADTAAWQGVIFTPPPPKPVQSRLFTLPTSKRPHPHAQSRATA